MSVGVPVKLLHEAEGHTVAVELRNGEVYRGLLTDAEDNMNCQLSAVTATAADGRVSKLEYVYLRGSQVRLMVLPDLLKQAPMFKKVQQAKVAADEAKARKGKAPGRNVYR